MKPAGGREFYTVEENEEFYHTAAQRFLRMNKGIKREQIFKDNVLDKYEFFKMYYQTYHWSKGVWQDKNQAKRMYDGIERYFLAYFDKLIRIFVNKNISVDDIMERVVGEAREVLNKSKLDEMVHKWREFASQLTVQKNYYQFPINDQRFKPIKHFNPIIYTHESTPQALRQLNDSCAAVPPVFSGPPPPLGPRPEITNDELIKTLESLMYQE